MTITALYVVLCVSFPADSTTTPLNHPQPLAISPSAQEPETPPLDPDDPTILPAARDRPPDEELRLQWGEHEVTKHAAKIVRPK